MSSHLETDLIVEGWEGFICTHHGGRDNVVAVGYRSLPFGRYATHAASLSRLLLNSRIDACGRN
jgi:hypothetical protein